MYAGCHVGVLSVLGTSRSHTVLNLVNTGDVVAIHSRIQLQQTLQCMQCAREHCLVTEALRFAACLASWSSMPLSVGVIPLHNILLLLLNPLEYITPCIVNITPSLSQNTIAMSDLVR